MKKPDFESRRKDVALLFAGIFLGVLSLFALLSAGSYLFTWKEDMSLLSGAGVLSKAESVANAGGKLGLRLGYLLVCRWFGLAGIGVVVALGVLSLRIVLGKFIHTLPKVLFFCLAGTAVFSCLLSLVSGMVGPDNAFGGGLGGPFGRFVCDWSVSLIGTVMTVLILLLLTGIYLVLVSPGFSAALAGIGKKASGTVDASGQSPEDSAADAPSCEKPSSDGTVSDDPSEKEPELADTPDPAADDDIEIVRDDSVSVKVEEPLPRIEPRLEDLPKYRFPSLDLLEAHSFGRQDVSKDELTRNNNKIRAALGNYGIVLDDVRAIVGPTVTLYKLYPAKGVKIAEIKRLQEDLAMSLNAKGVRVTVLEDSVGIEVANDVPSIVPIRAMLNDAAFRTSKADLPIAIGYTITQKVKVFDLADTPHLLVAGATKQGKSVGLNTIVASLLYSKHPSELKFVFIDPKMVEFSAYNELLKHYLAVLPDASSEDEEKANAIVKKPKDAEKILRSLCMEMDDRYQLLSDACVNNIKLYNDKYQDRRLLPTKGHRYLPYIVTIVDEYADLTLSSGASPEVKAASKSIQNSIIRLAQKGRAAGIHVIIATQRPSVDVISGIIKANFPTRIAFRVISRVDSNTILDSPGAEKLIGNGDMIYYSGVESERVQCAYISNKEITALTKFIGSQQGYQKSYNTPYYLPDPSPEGEEAGMVDINSLDERLEEAARMVVLNQKGSTSDLQRRLGMGYARAGKVMDQLEAIGIVGPQEGSKPRQVLVQSQDDLENIIKAYKL